MHTESQTLILICFSFKKNIAEAFGCRPVKALAKEQGHAATAWGRFNRLVEEWELSCEPRTRRSLDINLNVIHLKSDSPLRAKAADNTYKHTDAHTNTQVYCTDSLSLINTNNPLERSCIAATEHMQWQCSEELLLYTCTCDWGGGGGLVCMSKCVHVWGKQ